MKDCPTCGGSGRVPDDYAPGGEQSTRWQSPGPVMSASATVNWCLEHDCRDQECVGRHG